MSFIYLVVLSSMHLKECPSQQWMMALHYSDSLLYAFLRKLYIGYVKLVYMQRRRHFCLHTRLRWQKERIRYQTQFL